MEVLGVVEVPMWLILVLMVILLLYVYGTWNHSVWSSVGIPGPKPLPLLGNMIELRKKTQFHAFDDWKKQYGSVYGIITGVRPQLVVHDPDMLREIMVKNSNNFVDRNLLDGLRPPEIDSGLFFLGGTTWKRIRTMMTPTFSGSKLKLMSHCIQRCSSLLIQNIANKAKNDREIDVKSVYGHYTLDVIASTAFGLETDSQTKDDDPFSFHVSKMFEGLTQGKATKVIITLVSLFPWISPMIGKLGVGFFDTEHTRFLISLMRKAIESRRNDDADGQKGADLLQMLVDAEAEADQITDKAGCGDHSKSHKRMTKLEMIGQGFIVLIAGYETTATTLQYLTYNLARNPEAQEKLCREIVHKLGDAEPTYENVSNLPYLDAAIHETLRLFPPVPQIDRKALKTIEIQGRVIPAGAGVWIPLYSLMHDAEFFTDPHSFTPERFLEGERENLDHLLRELPFGFGVRQCIGMRLALLEMKFAAVNVCRKFRFVKGPNTPEKITFLNAFGLATPDLPIMVKAEQRSS